MNNKFIILGMHCEACQKVIEKRLLKIAGVTQANVLFNGNVTISADRQVSKDEVKLVLEGTDYQVS